MFYLKKLFLFPVVFILISSTVTFSQVKDQPITDTTKSEFSYNLLEKTLSKIDKVSIVNKEKLYKELQKVNIIYGTVYFSGAGFSNVVALSITGVGSIGSYLDRCVAGTQITFDNCKIKKDDGTIIKDFQKGILFY